MSLASSLGTSPTSSLRRDTESEGEFEPLSFDLLKLTTSPSTARGEKAKALTAAVNHPSYEFVQVDDLIKDDLTEALKGTSNFLHNAISTHHHVFTGVYGVAHVASPLPGKTSDVDDALDVSLVDY